MVERSYQESAGIEAVSGYLQSARENGAASPPLHLLTAPSFSVEIKQQIPIGPPPSSDACSIGSYLVTAIDMLDRSVIAYDYDLWSWLSLYYFDLLCPPQNGVREVLEEAVYILAEKFDYKHYYRHLLRTSWLAVKENGEAARALLTKRGKRSEIFEQIDSRQAIFGNKAVIAYAYKLYFDPVTGSPRLGSAEERAVAHLDALLPSFSKSI